jgi:hypothetical protein
MRRSPRLVAVGILCLFVLTACGPFVDASQPRSDALPITASSLGQTFVAYHDGLSSLDVALSGGSEPVRLTLFDGPEGQIVATAQAQAAPDEPWTRFVFSPLAHSHGRRYYLALSAPEPMTAALGPADAYQQGALYVEDAAQEAQLTFRLVYDPPALIAGLLGWLVRIFLPALATLGLVLLPGAALLSWLQPARTRSPGEALGFLALAATSSLALLPVLFLAARLLGLRLGPLATWGLLIFSALALVARRIVSRRSPRGETDRPRPWQQADWAWTVAALAVVGLVVAVRVLVVRSLEIPLWGDSVQHAAIVQLMLDHGGLFDSWLPYTPFQSFTVHFGFHAASAFLAWLVGAEAPRAVVLAGQMWNVVAVLAPYPLVVHLSGDDAKGRWAGLAAVLVAGLLSPMPMGYLNWGRYSQLAGLALLPGALVFLWRAIEAGRWKPGAMILAALALAGAFLAYYRIAFFYATFVLVWGLVYLLPRLRLDLRRWLDVAGRLAVVAALAGLFVLPRLLDLSGGYLDEAVEVTTSQGLSIQAADVMGSYREWHGVALYLPWALTAVAGLGLAWSLVRRRWVVVAVALWAAVLAAMNAAQLIGLPGAGMMTHFAVMISLYLPASLLIGWLVGEVAGRWALGGLAWGLAALLLALGLWGAKDCLRTLDPFYTLVTPPDEIAMRWIEAHTPPDSVFLVNGFSLYEGQTAVGSDAGWWIPLLAGRQNTMPPQYALFNERAIVPGYRQAVVALVRQLEQTGLGSAEGLAAACDLGVTHVYVGQLQGQMGIPVPRPLFTADELLANPAVAPIYHQDRVWIFALVEGACAD